MVHCNGTTKIVEIKEKNEAEKTSTKTHGAAWWSTEGALYLAAPHCKHVFKITKKE